MERERERGGGGSGGGSGRSVDSSLNVDKTCPHIFDHKLHCRHKGLIIDQ